MRVELPSSPPAGYRRPRWFWRGRPKGAGWRRRKFGLRILSGVPGAYFTAELAFWWNPISLDELSMGEALDSIIDCMRGVARKSLVTELAVAEMATLKAISEKAYSLALAGALASTELRLTVDKSSTSLTAMYLAEVRANKVRAASLDAYLQGLQEIFQRPGLASLWWVSEKPDQISLIGEDVFSMLVAQQAGAVNATSSDATISDRVPDEAAQLLHEFVERLEDEEQRAVIAGILKNFSMLMADSKEI